MNTIETIMAANEARLEIHSLADIYSWETICREMVSRMSGSECTCFIEDFNQAYSSAIDEDNQ